MISKERAIEISKDVENGGFDIVAQMGGWSDETLGRYLRLANKTIADMAMEELKTATIKMPERSTSTWLDGPKILSLDIETLPAHVRVWGLYKQRIPHKNIIKDWSMLSWAAKWIADDEIMGDVLCPEDAVAHDDSLLVEQLWRLLDEADIVIAHNAKQFDIRKINARFQFNGIDVPPSPYQIIDTLIESRKVFAHTSHTQDYLTKMLKLPKKLETDYQLWIDCDNGDETALARMFEYNKGDIAGLEELYFKMRPWMRSHPNLGLYYDECDLSRCPKCGTKDLFWGDKYYYTPMGRYKSFRCNDCGSVGRDRKSDIAKEEREVLVSTVSR